MRFFSEKFSVFPRFDPVGASVFAAILFTVFGGLVGDSVDFPVEPVCAQEKVTLPSDARKPNIILILTDDMGYSDLGCFGSEIPTPAIDSLAEQGVRFTQFYNCARCYPTRASLLTGLYPHQTGIGHRFEETDQPGYQPEMNPHCVTIAEVLSSAGYRSYGAGKWHVVDDRLEESRQKKNWPLQRGFQKFYGMITGSANYFDPFTLVRDNLPITKYTDPSPTVLPEEYYFTNTVSAEAVRYLKEHQEESPDSPFFLYVAYTAPHWPMQAPDAEIATFRGKYDSGYASVREKRFERLRELGLIDPNWELSETVGDFENLEHREWEIRCMEVYAAMISTVDQGVAKIVDQLKVSDQFDNTLILYLQDNGASDQTPGRQPMTDVLAEANRTTHPPVSQDDRKNPFSKVTRDGRAVRGGEGVMPGAEDTYIAYGRDWANVSNTPFRYYKKYLHEGGISTPLIAHWPKGIAGANRIDATPGHLIDIMATCVDLAKGEYPNQREGQTVYPMEGESLAPLFVGGSLKPRPLYWEHGGCRAVRDGDWKLVAAGPEAQWELYNIKEDRTEMKNLVEEYPELAQKLEANWIAWANRVNVLPWIVAPPFSVPL